MKTTIISTLLIAAIFSISSNHSWAQQTGTAKEIEKVIEDFFNAISARDVSGVRNVLGKRFVAMDVVTESGKKNSRIEVLDTANSEKILPPEGNTDMANLRVSSLKAEFSDSNPTVAISSFVASRPLTETELEGLRSTLAIDPKKLDDLGVDPAFSTVRRARIKKWVSEKKFQVSMFAMLGRQDGKWKIVCMSFPE